MATSLTNTWVEEVQSAMKNFADKYSKTYAKSERQIAAYFEIGCFLAIIEFYEEAGFEVTIQNTAKDGSFRYLTTPNGNPENFSYLLMKKDKEQIEIRQQVRILSHVGDDVTFTPDIVVISHTTKVQSMKSEDYAGGKRSFFFVYSKDVIAAHECKSMDPFPELLVSFIGMLVVGHQWTKRNAPLDVITPDGLHLAPALFVGGSPRSIHLRMIKGLKSAYPINIVVGMHSGTWDLFGDHAKIQRMRNPLEIKQSSTPVCESCSDTISPVDI
jgi:hypothetical protein